MEALTILEISLLILESDIFAKENITLRPGNLVKCDPLETDFCCPMIIGFMLA